MDDTAATVGQLADIVRLASGCLWLVDSEYSTLAISRATADLLGYEPHELVGRPTLTLSADPEQTQRNRLAIGLDGAHEGEAILTNKRGRVVRLRYQARQLVIDSEAVVLSAVEPVTPAASHEAVVSLHDVMHEFRQAGVPQGYWLVRIEQGEQAVRVLSALLHDLHNAVMDDVADEPFAR